MKAGALPALLGVLAIAGPALAQDEDAGVAEAVAPDAGLDVDNAPAPDDAPVLEDVTLARTTATVPVSADKDTWGIGGHPIIGYSPESRWTLGAGLAFYYNPRPWDPDQRLDEYVLQATYTTRKQGSLGLDSTTYLGGNRHFLEHKIKFTDTPSSFFGIGPNTPESAEESYTQSGMELQIAYQTMVREGLYLGPDMAFAYSRLYDETPGGLLAQGAVIGTGITREIGIGFLATYDSTNSKLYKHRGSRVQLRGRVNHPWLGGSHAFWGGSLGCRHFVPLFWNMILAFQLAAGTTNGDVPFYDLEPLGGDKLLRGYSSERYIAKHFLGGQAELRYHVFWRFGGVFFLGVAEVENRVRDFGTTPRAAAGMGWRFAINRRQTINLRFDITYNSDGEAEKYIKLREAF
ncbi:MAG TPA: BamA/TamA family outer membrane protein [Polyangia bacterium]